MPSLSAASSSNALYSPSYIPVLVVIGGTSGIGQAMVEQFARQTSGRAHIIIMGRNATAAKTILDSLPKSTVEGDPEMRREFVSCDALLMKSMKETAEGLLERLPKINFLVVCSGWASFRGRNETEEGIDKQMACRYYSRWKLIYELLPLLRKARDAGEDAKVMSVLAAGVPGSVNVQDLAMKKSYSGLKAVTTTALYNDYALEVCFLSLSSLFTTRLNTKYRNSPYVSLALHLHIYILARSIPLP